MMLSEAHQISYLIRFVAPIVGKAAKWIGGLFRRKLPSTRRVETQRELVFYRTRSGDRETRSLVFKWNRLEYHDQGASNSNEIAKIARINAAISGEELRSDVDKGRRPEA
jgi:hypothetical protein